MTTGLDIPEVYLPLWTGSTPEIPNIEHFAFYGGRGGAKSHTVGTVLIMLASQKEERVVCGRQFQTSVKDSVKELLERKIKELNVAVYWTSTETELKNNVTGSRFTFIGMDRNPDSARSLEAATKFWGDEAASFTSRSVEIIIPTIRSQGSQLIWTWNPRYRTDAVDKLFRGGNPPPNSYIKEVSWRHNPYFYRTRLPSELEQALRANDRRYHHVWEGGYDENSDATIFPKDSWEIGRIDTGKAIPRFGLDFGFSADPHALAKVYVLDWLPEPVLYIAEEAVGHRVPNLSLPDFLDGVSEVRDYPIVADSSQPAMVDFLNSSGFNVFGAKKGNGSVRSGISYLQSFKIIISPDCPIAAQEVRDYRWHLDPNGNPLPIPAPRQKDHLIDAIRYAVESLSERGAGNEEESDVLYI